MKKKNIVTIIILIIASFTYAQNDTTILWQNTIGGNDADFLTSVSTTTDGGFIVGGYSLSEISGDKTEDIISSFYKEDFWVLKLNNLGFIEWQKTIGTGGIDKLESIKQTTDGGYIVGGYTYPDMFGNIMADYWAIKLDATGNIEWENKIGGDNEDVLTAIKQTADGGYILGGYSHSDSTGDKTEDTVGSTPDADTDYEDYWVVKLNSSGNIEWQNTIGGNYHDQLYDVIQTLNGNYILVGWSESNISGDKTENTIGASQYDDFWVVKLNSSGNIIWENTIGGDYDDVAMSVVEAADGGYVIAGSSESNISGDKTENAQGQASNNDYWVVKLNTLGNIEWQNTIGGSLNDELSGIAKLTNGGYILGGSSTSKANGDKTETTLARDYWIVKINNNGVIEWDNTIKSNKADVLTSIATTANNTIVVGGFSSSGISGDKTENQIGSLDYWILEVSEPTLNIRGNNFEDSVLVYPIPTEGKFTIDLGNVFDSISFNLIDITGKTILSDQIHHSNKIEIALNFPTGLYIINLKTPHKNTYIKLVIN